MERFNFITIIIDWIENKVKTKTGCILIGILAGLIFPSSYIYFQIQEKELLNEKIRELKEDIIAQKKLTSDWRTRAIESDNNCIEKMKQMMLFFNQLEDSYNKKKGEQTEMYKQLSKQTETLKIVSKNLTK